MIAELSVALILSLAMTLVFEICFFFLAGELLQGKLFTSKRNKKELMLVVMVNIITNPVVVLAYWLVWLYTSWNRIIVLILLEIMAVITEGYYFKRYGQSFRRPFVFSLTANAFSYTIGAVIQILLSR